MTPFRLLNSQDEVQQACDPRGTVAGGEGKAEASHRSHYFLSWAGVGEGAGFGQAF